MKTLSTRLAAAAALFALPVAVHAAQKSFRDQLVEKLSACEYSLEVVMGKPETAVPAEVLRQAKGIILVHQFRAGLIFGGQGGSAVLVARIPQTGNWNVPVFLDPGGVNFGLQAGVKEMNSVFVLMTDEAVQAAYSGRFKFGVDAAAVAGPRSADAQNFDLFKASVLVYNSYGGLYAGAAVKSGWLAPFDRANREFYGTPHATPEIALGTWFQVPPEAQSVLARIRAAEGTRK